LGGAWGAKVQKVPKLAEHSTKTFTTLFYLHAGIKCPPPRSSTERKKYRLLRR